MTDASGASGMYAEYAERTSSPCNATMGRFGDLNLLQLRMQSWKLSSVTLLGKPH